MPTNWKPKFGNPRYGLLGVLHNADLNIDTDQVFDDIDLPPAFIADKLIVANPSATLDTVVFDIWTAADGGGDKLATYDSATAVNAEADLASIVAAVTTSAAVERGKTALHLLCSTKQGADATADILIFGFDLTT